MKMKKYHYIRKINDKRTQKIWNNLNKINEKYPWTMLQYAKLVLKHTGYKIK